MDWLTYELLNDFQTAIVGIIGFAGVIWVQKDNAKLARKQQNAELATRRNAVENALYAEIALFKKAFERIISNPISATDETLHFPILRRDVSIAMMPEIGLLKSETIIPVLNGFNAIDDVNLQIALLAEEESANSFLLEGNKINVFFQILEDAIGPLDVAIEALVGDP